MEPLGLAVVATYGVWLVALLMSSLLGVALFAVVMPITAVAVYYMPRGRRDGNQPPGR